MRKILLTFAALFIAVSAYGVSFAQDTQPDGKSKPTTVDAWRGAMPQNELPAYVEPIEAGPKKPAKVEETAEQVGTRVFALEQNLLESLKQRDSAALNQLLIDDFMLSGVSLEGTQPDKARYIDWSMKNLDLKGYSVEKSSIRAYPTIAIITVQYKNSTAAAAGTLVATDVWVRNGKQWQLLSRHFAQPYKA